jgi:uncharacterized protein (UPF0335 family)
MLQHWMAVNHILVYQVKMMIEKIENIKKEKNKLIKKSLTPISELINEKSKTLQFQK